MKSALAAAVRVALRAGPPETHAAGRCNSLTDEQLERLVAHTDGSPSLAALALRIRPWPAWVMPVLYPNRRSVP